MGPSKNIPVDKTAVPKKTVKKTYNKKELIAGTALIILAFVCFFVVFYFVVSANQETAEQYSALQEETIAINIERSAAKKQALDLQEKAGASLSLQKLLQESASNYGPEEKKRKEGTLWIDRVSGTFFVTLGALHGLTPGSKLTVYDGDKEWATVRVETPLDVISYVQPVDKGMDDFMQDYYRVVFR